MSDQAQQGTVVEIGEQAGFHDLEALARDVHREYYQGEDPIDVRWGKRTSRKRRISIRLGSYDYTTRLIRIHPLLDSSRVPGWFVQSIIFHEYLHHFLGSAHNRRFHRYEKHFLYDRESKIWLERFLPMLLGSRPLPVWAVHPRRSRRPRPEHRQIALF